MSHEPVVPATEPIPTAQVRPSWAEAFFVLRNPNFRRFVSSYSVLVTSLSMQRIMLAWGVLEVSGNIMHVGFAIAMQYLPMLLLGLPGGVVADRWGKRRILILCQIAFLLVAGTILVFAAIGALNTFAIYAFGMLIGIIQAFQLPASQGIIGEIVRTREIPPAVSFTSSAFQAGQVIGPSLGGILLAQIGSTWSWSINLVIIGASTLLLLRVSTKSLTRFNRSPEVKVTTAAGFRYLAEKPVLVLVLALIFVVATCVYATPVFLTAYAEQEFHIGAAGYGVLNSIMAAGALIGALLSAKRPAPTLTAILLFTIALGVSQAIMGVALGLTIFTIALFVRGATSLFTTTAANAFIQVRSNPLIRGRVMSFYGMMMNGGMASGNLIVGVLIASFGVRPVMIATGFLPAIIGLVIWLLVRRSALRG